MFPFEESCETKCPTLWLRSAASASLRIQLLGLKGIERLSWTIWAQDVKLPRDVATPLTSRRPPVPCKSQERECFIMHRDDNIFQTYSI